jgi:hypothetical protein
VQFIYLYWTSFLSFCISFLLLRRGASGNSDASEYAELSGDSGVLWICFPSVSEAHPKARMLRSRTRSSLATPVSCASVSRRFLKQRRKANFLEFFQKEKKTRKTKTYRRRRRCSCLGDAAVCCDCGEDKRRREELGSVVVPTSMCRLCAPSLCVRLFDRSVGNATHYFILGLF